MEPQRTFTPPYAPLHDSALLPVKVPAQLVGRSRELGAMQSTLKVGAAIFVSGGTGLGKTALAATVASAYATSNVGGVIWLNANEDDFETLVARIGRAYNVIPPVNSSEPGYIERIHAVLEKTPPLIVLDGIIDIDAAPGFMRSCSTGIS